MGYRVLGPRILRVDRVERLAVCIRTLSRQGAFGALPELADLAGCGLADLPAVLEALGYRARASDAQGPRFRGRHRPAASRPIPARHDPDSPFAKLKELSLAR
jgi:ATP-dependent RNA helicase SUPV3L1/SUV3